MKNQNESDSRTYNLARVEYCIPTVTVSSDLQHLRQFWKKHLTHNIFHYEIYFLIKVKPKNVTPSILSKWLVLEIKLAGLLEI